MQQLQDKMEMTRPRLGKMADARAMELLAQHPQTLAPRVGPASEVAQEVRGGMSARLARVAGVKKGGTNGRMESRMFGSGKSDRAVVEELMASHEKDGKLQGGFLGALLGAVVPSLLGKLFGDGMSGGAMCGSAMCGEGAPVDPTVLKKARTKKAMTGGAGMYAETAKRQNAPASARVPASGATVAPGAVAPFSEMGAPEAPVSFRRNTVGMGKGKSKAKAFHTMPDGTVMPGATHGGMVEPSSPPRLVPESGKSFRSGFQTPPKKPKAVRMLPHPTAVRQAPVNPPTTPRRQMQSREAPDAMVPPPLPKRSGGGRSARGQKIASLMKSMGMSLGEASRFLKQNPDA